MKRFAMAIVFAFGLSSLASAAILPTFMSEANLGGGIWSYTYQINVQAPDQEIMPTASGPGGSYNNHFTFVDFLGFTGTATSTGLLASSFAESTSATGPSAFLQAPTDSASIPNITWTYTGTGTIAPGTTLGTVTLDSTDAVLSSGVQEFVGQATKATGDTAGTVVGNAALTVGPSPSIPEPGTLMLLGGAFVGLGLLRKVKRPA